MAERYTVKKMANHVWVMDKNRLIADCGYSYVKKNREDAQLIARALNAYAALEQVKSIGEANGGKDE